MDHVPLDSAGVVVVVGGAGGAGGGSTTTSHKEGKWGLAGRRRVRGHLGSKSRLLAATKLVVVELSPVQPGGR